MAKYIRETITPGSKIYTMDGAMSYWLYDYNLRIGFPTQLDDLRGYGYYVVAPFGDDILAAIDSNADAINAELDNPEFFTELYATPNDQRIIYSVNFQ
jgi:hypothetical protein